MIALKVYSPSLKSEWNHFVYGAKNSTFIHLREYMDYHNTRFTDNSLIAYSGGKIIGVLPANIVGDTLYSHQGLSYGGWLVHTKHFDVSTMLRIFEAMRDFLPTIGIRKLVYKPSPHIYHSYPSEEDIYAIFKYDGKLLTSTVSATIPINEAIRFNENARRAVKSASALGITVEETEDYAPYWEILSKLLTTRYKVNPVHTLDEINLLHSLFPLNIRLFTANLDDKVLGGVLVYNTGIVAHAQYIAASEEGKEKKVLPLIFKQLIGKEFSKCKYFDFGTSNEQNGRYLNEGLSMQKTGMGGRAVVYNSYELNF
ncbi:MAG: GNAT family N-acetyltransferase [Muribaculaceae bacterium]|nr:GNAT family N-acetyltransferase [Muribaculaceae bacterium]